MTSRAQTDVILLSSLFTMNITQSRPVHCSYSFHIRLRFREDVLLGVSFFIEMLFSKICRETSLLFSPQNWCMIIVNTQENPRILSDVATPN